jgi:serine/threonine-protein kinase PpkA
MSAPAFEIPGYELVRELGSGGMATVFLAVQRSLDRKVAIKVMRRGLADDNVEKRFLMEGRTMARLPHPNIVGVYDIVQNESINYIAMEFLEGGMLSDRMREGLTLAEAISVVVQIAGALQYAHDNNIVHRDLKPSNIMFRDAVTPVLTDFGIAKQQSGEATRLTQTGMMIGTPTYMSPEQATGSELDGRSDQYALGVLFFEMLTGHAPFEGSTPIQVVLAHLNTPPPPLPPQFAFFQPLMDRMLAKDREQRFTDLKIFVKELKQLLTGSDALLQKLRIDPNQSASEQLRALGFSESQIHTGAGQAPRISAQRPAVNRQRTTGSGPGVRLGNEPAEQGRPRWLIPAVAATVLAVAAVGGWFALSGTGGDAIDPATQLMLNDQLDRIDQLIAEGKLVGAEGDSAFARLQVVYQVALKSVDSYPPADQRQARIVGLLREQASKALAAKSYDDAERRVQEALGVLPEDPESVKLRDAIAAARLSAEREVEVAGWIAKATAAQRANRFTGSDSALAALQQALQIDPNSAPAKQALAALVTQLLQPTQRALDAGRLDEAEGLLERLSADLGVTPEWQALSKRLGEVQAAQAQKQRIDSLIALARNQMAKDRIAEPAGDNTLETLQRVFEIDPQQAQALALRRDAAAALVRAAKQAEARSDFSLALARYDQALKANPQDQASLAARQALEQRVGERQAAVARNLSAAREAIAVRNYFAPAKQNAQELLQAVLATDPNNAAARQLLAELPKLARESAEALAGEGRVDAAIELLKQAQAAYKNDAQIALLTSRLNSQREAEQKSARRGQLLADIREQLALRQLNADTARKIGFALAELQKLDPADAEARAYREQFFRGIGTVVERAARPQDLAPLGPVLEQLRSQLGNTAADVAALGQALAARGEAIAAAERERIDASSGWLVLNATPWANVESVVDQGSGKAVELSGERSTPLRLKLVEGTYRVTFRHPNEGRSVVQVATVRAKQAQTVSAGFPNLTAADYLKRAGYAN